MVFFALPKPFAPPASKIAKGDEKCLAGGDIRGRLIDMWITFATKIKYERTRKIFHTPYRHAEKSASRARLETFPRGIA